jgi:hypothetical protein
MSRGLTPIAPRAPVRFMRATLDSVLLANGPESDCELASGTPGAHQNPDASCCSRPCALIPLALNPKPSNLSSVEADSVSVASRLQDSASRLAVNLSLYLPRCVWRREALRAGNTALRTAITLGDGDCIAALLGGGASVNMETARGTPLVVACIRGDPAVVRTLS